MSRKRSEWLEADLEDDDGIDSASDAEESRGQAVSRRNIKRRKLALEQDSEEQSDRDLSDTEAVAQKPAEPAESAKPASQSAASGPLALQSASKKSKVHKKLDKVRDATSRSGVVYLSRVPPFMKPLTLKNLLLPYASKGIGRIFLTPEAHEQRQSRIRGGGNKKKSFTDGWIEFVSKKEAKSAVQTLNARTIGGKKGGYYVDDVWNLKYLKGFKWRHLTEQIANENAERSARMRAEGSSTRREMNEFLKNVDRSKIQATRQQKKAKAGKPSDPVAVTAASEARDRFRQNKPVAPRDQTADREPDADVQRVLSKIF